MGAGVVFKVDASGAETVLHAFTGGEDGVYPKAPLVRDSEGNLYGNTNGGGSAGAGVVFKLDMNGAEAVLYTFAGGADGESPAAGLVRDSAGNLYGTTYSGGLVADDGGYGVVFKLNTAGVETVLHTFTGKANPHAPTDGAHPEAGLVLDSAGNLYGTTISGGRGCETCGNLGRQGFRVVFKVDTAGTETVLRVFTAKAGGWRPLAGLILDSEGDLYGSTLNGGLDGGNPGYGVVFKLTP
jgi:uncharacterized repeat protein (TIGR03803 family)